MAKDGSEPITIEWLDKNLWSINRDHGRELTATKVLDTPSPIEVVVGPMNESALNEHPFWELSITQYAPEDRDDWIILPFVQTVGELELFCNVISGNYDQGEPDETES